MTFRVACSLWGAAFVLAAGCGDDGRPGVPRDAGGIDATSARDAEPVDAPPAMACSGDGDCDDGFDCTIDMCAVGGVCRHTPLNERCADGELCSLTEGCTSGCMEDVDCQDGDFCNGRERCIAGDCFMGTAADCDDGNACTVDMCSTEAGGCVYDIAEGCDAGVPPPGDGGAPAVPFDASMHYDGTFVVAPAPSLGCPPASYAFGELSFAIVGGDLQVRADRFTLTQSPAPTTADFDVSGTDGSCPTVRLSGSFANSNQFDATWMASCSGFCGSQTNMIFGERR